VTEVEAAIEQLRVRFLGRAAADLNDLRQWRRDPRAHKADLHPLVHRLAGAAGTFGFHRLSALAAKAEDAIVSDRPDTTVALAAVVDELERITGRA
jgi:HPt (histidine-containing phosphotransfer) domain-containing protein